MKLKNQIINFYQTFFNKFLLSQFDYFFEATFMDLGPTGEAIGVIEDTRIAFTMVIDLTTGVATLVEDDFNIDDVGYKIL